MKNLYLVMTRANWNKIVNAVDGANNAAWAGQHFEVYNGSNRRSDTRIRHFLIDST